MKSSLQSYSRIILGSAALLATVLGARLDAQTLFTPGGTVGSSTNGNVGINTNGPRQPLEVQRSSNPAINIHDSGTAELTMGVNEAMILAQFNTNSGGFRFVSGQDGLTFPGAGSEIVRFAANGNVGIGTSNPGGYKLYVSGKDSFFGQPSGTTGFGLSLQEYGGSRNWSIRDDYGVNRLRFSRGATDATWLDVTKIPASDGVSAIIAYATNEFLINQAGGATKFNINLNGLGASYINAGNFGIGTTSPTANLNVVGYADHTNGNILISGNNAPTLFVKNNNGNLVTQIMAWDGAGNDAMAGARIGTRSRSSKSAHLHFTTDDVIRLTVKDDGNVGIGTTTPTQKLSVNGTIRAKEVIVDSGWADHVFTPAHRLAPLAEVEQHIAEHGRLPGMPSAEQVQTEGIAVSDAQRLLLEKVEELTLHLIRLEKANAAHAHENAELRQRVLALESLR